MQARIVLSDYGGGQAFQIRQSHELPLFPNPVFWKCGRNLELRIESRPEASEAQLIQAESIYAMMHSKAFPQPDRMSGDVAPDYVRHKPEQTLLFHLVDKYWRKGVMGL